MNLFFLTFVDYLSKRGKERDTLCRGYCKRKFLHSQPNHPSYSREAYGHLSVHIASNIYRDAEGIVL